tara:strand:+ start:283 stop:1050 length:768 start_codon:yes stop_codon:yes gene_type:complete
VAEVKKYVVIGRGDAPGDVISAGLRDLGEDTHFYVPWLGGKSTEPTAGMKKVYDFLVDTGATFTMLAKVRDMPHPALLSNCIVVKESGSEQPDMNFTNIPHDATALMLWDDSTEAIVSGHEWMACEYFDRGHPLLDLTNGLTPIEVESTTTPPAREPDSPIQEDEIPPLTDDDMESMPEGIRKQLDKSLGNQDEDEDESIEETTAKILQFVRKEEPTDESQFATVVVVLPTGRSFTTSVPILNLWSLLEETVWQE